MSDNLRQELDKLGEPDLEAVDRIWARYTTTRALEPRRRRRRIAGGVVALAAAAALTALWASAEEPERSVDLASPVTPVAHDWGRNVSLQAVGQGTMTGTDADSVLEWSTGTVQVEVTPKTNTRMAVVTEEARVEVIGTVFQVRRDALGSTVGVDRGEVAVHCKDGTQIDLTAGQSHTCLPVTAAGLLGRAEELNASGRRGTELAKTLDRGIAVASGGPVLGELLWRRIEINYAEGDLDAVLADAERYLSHDSGQSMEVSKRAAYLAHRNRDCARAIPWLQRLHAQGSALDSVMLAECLAPTDPERARELVHHALPALDEAGSERAQRVLNALGEN